MLFKVQGNPPSSHTFILCAPIILLVYAMLIHNHARSVIMCMQTLVSIIIPILILIITIHTAPAMHDSIEHRLHSTVIASY